MKAHRAWPLTGGGLVAAVLLLVACQIAPLTKPAAAPPAARVESGIPDRPEKLSFPPLVFEPPDPVQFRVPLRSGPVAYLVPDRELPLVHVVVLIRAGTYLDPPGREGLAEMTGHLLARGGTQTRRAEDLEERLAFLAAHLNSAIAGDQGSVSLNLLSKDLDDGLALLREVLATPAFQEDKIALRKQQMLQAMKQRNDDAADIEQRERGYLAFGEHFWVNQYATADSVDAIRREDLQAFHRRWVHPRNFVVAASGDFDREAMLAHLERLFADWPFVGETPPPVPTNAAFASPGLYLVHKPVNQGRVAMMLPGIRRDHPDYFPVMVMNDILGGGGFTSRIVSRVRSDEGLAYDARSSFPGGTYFPLTFTASFQTKSRTVAYAISLVREELDRIAREPVNADELRTAQAGFIERFPRHFATKAQVAGLFAQEEFTGRFHTEPDFWKRYRPRIQAVTTADVQRVARAFLPLERLVTLVVGDKDEILQGHPNYPVTLPAVAGCPITELPLRDPLTLKPLPLRADKTAAASP